MRLRLLTGLWLLLDFSLVAGAYAITMILIQKSALPPLPIEHFLLIGATAPLVVMFLWTSGVYSLARSQRTVPTAFLIFFANVGASSLLLLSSYSVLGTPVSLRISLFHWVAGGSIVWLFHLLYTAVLPPLLRLDPPVFPTLLIGCTGCTESVLQALQGSQSPLKVVGILETDGSKKELQGVPVIGRLQKLEEILESKRITHVVQCASTEQSVNIQEFCEKRAIVYLIPTCSMGVLPRQERMVVVNGRLLTAEGPRRGLLDGVS